MPKEQSVTRFLPSAPDRDQNQISTMSITNSERKVVVKTAEMSDDMQQDAVDCAIQVCKYVRSRKPEILPTAATAAYCMFALYRLWTNTHPRRTLQLT